MPPESPILSILLLVPLVETPAKLTTICFTPEGIPVKVIDVPDVVAVGVPRVKPAASVVHDGKPDPALVNTCPFVPAAPARVKAVVRSADAIVGAVSVLLVSVVVLDAVTTLLGVMIPDSATVAMI